MEIKIKLPNGGYLEFKREPMEPYKLYAIVWAICLSIVLPAFFSIFK